MDASVSSPCTIGSIILADDDGDDRMIFQDVLKSTVPNIKLHIVADGYALMSLLSNYMPDLLFLDLEMPYKNGLQCLKEIRENSAFATLPIIVFSSSNSPKTIATVYEMGTHLSFKKPSSFQEFQDSLKTILHLEWNDPEKIRKKYFVDCQFVSF